MTYEDWTKNPERFITNSHHLIPAPYSRPGSECRDHQPDYNEALHETLAKVKTRLPAIQQLLERLSGEGILITLKFNNDEVVTEARPEELRKSIYAKKTDETVVLPDDWRQTIEAVFKDLQDFYIFDAQDLAKKELYITVKEVWRGIPRHYEKMVVHVKLPNGQNIWT